ncbi:MAG: hypothetical protein LBH20_01775 [Treponema sp.]|jgi:hypothetical protein|nr:hypothetical protein [Treponema sp.]
MNKEELIPLAEKLNAELDKKKRNDIVADFCKEKGLKPGDVWKQLKETGGDPPAPPDGGQSGSDQSNNGQEARKVPVLVSHKTGYEKYRCAGLVLARKPENYLVTEEQYEKLRRDPWVTVIGGEKRDGADK